MKKLHVAVTGEARRRGKGVSVNLLGRPTPLVYWVVASAPLSTIQASLTLESWSWPLPEIPTDNSRKSNSRSRKGRLNKTVGSF